MARWAPWRASSTLAAAAGVATVTVAVALAGCANVSYDPEPLKLAQVTDAPEVPAGAVDPGTGGEEKGTGTGSGEEGHTSGIDVCGLISTDEIQQIFELAEAPEAAAELAISVPELPDGVHCTYRVGTDGPAIAVTVFVDPEQEDPAPFVAELPEGEPVEGTGDASGIDRSGQLADGVALLRASQATDTGMFHLQVGAPEGSADDALVAVATIILEQVAA